jgi:hypothetical protein
MLQLALATFYMTPFSNGRDDKPFSNEEMISHFRMEEMISRGNKTEGPDIKIA